MKTQNFNKILKEYALDMILEQDPMAAGMPAAGMPAPPAPADPSKVSPNYKEDLDPIQFVASRINSLIELGNDEIFKEITRTNLEARKPLQIKSTPIDQSKDIDDFIKSFKDNYTKEYYTLKNFIEVTTEGNPKYEQLKRDINQLLRLSKKHVDTDEASIEPSNVAAAPM